MGGSWLMAVDAINANIAWIVGESQNGLEGVIMFTQNGGATWVDQTPTGIKPLQSVSMVSQFSVE